MGLMQALLWTMIILQASYEFDWQTRGLPFNLLSVL